MIKCMVKEKYHIGNVSSSESGSTKKSVDQKTECFLDIII